MYIIHWDYYFTTFKQVVWPHYCLLPMPCNTIKQQSHPWKHNGGWCAHVIKVLSNILDIVFYQFIGLILNPLLQEKSPYFQEGTSSETMFCKEHYYQHSVEWSLTLVNTLSKISLRKTSECGLKSAFSPPSPITQVHCPSYGRLPGNNSAAIVQLAWVNLQILQCQ